MTADDDHPTATKTPVWPIVLAVVLGFAFVGSFVAAFVIGYFSVGDPPSGPVYLDGQPAWQDQLQPGDRIITVGPSDSSPVDFDDLRQNVILGEEESDGMKLQLIRDGETIQIRSKPKREAQPKHGESEGH